MRLNEDNACSSRFLVVCSTLKTSLFGRIQHDHGLDQGSTTTYAYIHLMEFSN